MNGSKWAERFRRWTPRLGVAGALIAAIGSFGAGLGLWAFTVGFAGLGLGVLLAVATLIAGLLALWLGRKQVMAKGGIWLGLVAALGLLLFFGNTLRSGAGNPMIHDVTTDLGHPPEFVKLRIRSDNLVGVETVDNWRKIHASAYGDIKPVVIANESSDQLLNRIDAMARKRGWTVALKGAGRLEVTATTRIFQFKDDVVITVTPLAKDLLQVNMRSVSRVGVGDLGVNAKRIREFLHALETGDGKFGPV